MKVSEVIRKYLRRLFKSESYAVAYRFLPSSNTPLGVQQPEYHLIKLGWNYWCADPFPFYYQGEWYIFVEIYHMYRTKARLGYYRLNQLDRVHIILDEPFHLSYPNVFSWGDDIYMIPETYQARQLRLYRASAFPDRWELDSVLLENRSLLDASVYIDGNIIYVEAMEKRGEDGCSGNRLFKLDMKSRSIVELDRASSSYIDRRPAGNFFFVENQLYHALQNCDRQYGEFVHIACVQSFSDGGLKEAEVMQFHVEGLPVKSDRRLVRTHTFNRIRELEVVDVAMARWMIVKPIFSFLRVSGFLCMGMGRKIARCLSRLS